MVQNWRSEAAAKVAKVMKKIHFLGTFSVYAKGSGKKRTFYGHADRKGGEGPLALTVDKCENFGLFFSKHIFSHCEGPQRCIFHVLNASAIALFNNFSSEEHL